MRSRTRQRVYWRNGRAWADFRDYADVGGKREPLRDPGEKLATQDPDVAQLRAAKRLKELDATRRGHAIHGSAVKVAYLADFAQHYLIEKKRSGAVTDDWIAAAELYLTRAVQFFGAGRNLASISVADVNSWVAHLQRLPNGRGATLSGWSARHHLGALSNLFRRAQGEGYVLPGFNPVQALLDKPKARHHEAPWLEVPEAGLFLESAKRYEPIRNDVAMPFAYPLVATFLLTGGRTAEVLGLEVEDVSFDRKTITFRPNRWRRLKTRTSHRAVPLWPQLEEILRPHVFRPDAPPRTLLFPSLRTGREAMVTDIRKLLDNVAQNAGWKAGEIRSKMFRHTYCAARLQTLDRGAPVSPYVVSRELGHGSMAMVQRVYSHLGQMRHRSEVVEYRVEPFADELGERLQAVAGNPLTQNLAQPTSTPPSEKPRSQT